MSGYTQDATDALNDLRDAGAAVTFTLHVDGSYDPATDVTVAAADATCAGYAIRTRGNPLKYEALGLVQSESPTLLFAPSTYGAKPALNSSVTWGGIVYRVKDVEPVDPDGQGAVVYKVMVSR